MTTIVDYGMGNLASIKNMLKKIGFASVITSSPELLENASRIILPGVGAFDNAMENIDKRELLNILNKKALVDKVPFLGICLGMQILMRSSEEGTVPGLSWIDGDVKRFKFDSINGNLKIPHMGWNLVSPRESNSIFKNLTLSKFYFVHSYYVACENDSEILATSKYGIEFVSSVKKGNIFGTQFHPEKSHKYGMELLRNFVHLC